MMMCGIIQLPTANYFASQAYDKMNEYDNGFKVIVSHVFVSVLFFFASSFKTFLHPPPHTYIYSRDLQVAWMRPVFA
jgi:hypothetical protein